MQTKIKNIWMGAIAVLALATSLVIAQDSDIPSPVAINYYGKVVDETGTPIQGATIKFTVLETMTDMKQTEYSSTSDAQGLFSLTGKNGYDITVIVSKDGYYRPVSSQGLGWHYNPENITPQPTQASPVLVSLRKKGIAEPLKSARIGPVYQSKDGTAKSASFEKQKEVTSDPQVTMQIWIDDQNKNAQGHYDWRYTITIPGGGLVLSTGEFDFTAPESGYQESIMVSYPKTLGQNWNGGSLKQCFIKLPNGKYLRGEFSVNGERGFWSFRGYLNPTGSRNLEYDPSKRAK